MTLHNGYRQEIRQVLTIPLKANLLKVDGEKQEQIAMISCYSSISGKTGRILRTAGVRAVYQPPGRLARQ